MGTENKTRGKMRMVKKWVALLLSCAMVLAGALTSWALPSGASMTEGNTVKSSKAGFVLTFPEGFEIISGWPGEAYQYFPEEGIHWDFSASISDETEEHFLTMAGMWVPLEGKSLEQQMAELIQTWTEEGVGTSSTPYLQTGTAAVADGGYYSIKINYGALLAESMRQLYESMEVELKGEEQAQLDSMIKDLEDSLSMDLYLREMEGDCYILVQLYSADQTGTAASLLSQARPFTGGWKKNGALGWKFENPDGSMLRDSWVLDENGLTCRLDSNGQLVHSVWIEEDGRWKYVDEFGHMVTSASKTIDGVQYVFDAYGYMEEKEKAAQPYSAGTLSGNRYMNQWADITLSFPETAQVEMGDDLYSHAVEGGENMFYWADDTNGYRITVEFTEYPGLMLDRYLEERMEYSRYYGYKIDETGTKDLGGYEYKYVKTSGGEYYGGVADHEDTYFRQIDGYLVEISAEYTQDCQGKVEQILQMQ